MNNQIHYFKQFSRLSKFSLLLGLCMYTNCGRDSGGGSKRDPVASVIEAIKKGTIVSDIKKGLYSIDTVYTQMYGGRYHLGSQTTLLFIVKLGTVGVLKDYLKYLKEELPVEKLICDLNARCGTAEETPLHLAVHKSSSMAGSYSDKACLLLSESEIDLMARNYSGKIFLHYIGLLPDSIEDCTPERYPKIEFSEIKKVLDLAEEKGVDINTTDKLGKSPLMTAIEWGDPIACAAFLASEKIDIDITDYHQNTLLHYIGMLRTDEMSRIFDITKVFGDEVVFDNEIKKCVLPRILASKKEILELLKERVKSRVDGSETDKDAAWKAYINRSINQQNKDGNTPLLLAVECNNQEVIQLIMDTGAPIAAENRQAAYQRAIKKSFSEIAKILKPTE